MGGGVSPNPKGFYQIFWHNLPKKGGLYKKLAFFYFFDHFLPKRGGVQAKAKKSLSEKTEGVKKGAGGGSQFFDQK